jgi:hypothetical protein
MVGCHLDGTWLRADLCEGQQRRKLRKRTADSPKTLKEKNITVLDQKLLPWQKI